MRVSRRICWRHRVSCRRTLHLGISWTTAKRHSTMLLHAVEVDVAHSHTNPSLHAKLCQSGLRLQCHPPRKSQSHSCAESCGGSNEPALVALIVSQRSKLTDAQNKRVLGDAESCSPIVIESRRRSFFVFFAPRDPIPHQHCPIARVPLSR